MSEVKKQMGFTLIELMIVIAIIGILMAYAIPAYRDYSTRVKAGECLAIMAGGKVAVSERWSATNSLGSISSNALAFMPVNTTISGPNVTSVTVNGAGQLVCDIGGTDTAINAATITLTPTASAGSLAWNCTTSIANAAHKPGGCV